MPEVKAVYHFFDQEACRNRTKGDVFSVTEKRAEELIKAGLVALTKDLFTLPTTEANKAEQASEEIAYEQTKSVANTEEEHIEAARKRTKTSKKSQRKQ